MFLLCIASTASAGGLGEVPANDRPLPRPEESLRVADENIADFRFDDAVPRLVDAVRADDEQLPAAEQRFDLIRQARAEYVAKGREVEAELRELIDGEISPEEVVPTAFAALRLISEMNAILPNPNPEDRSLIANLQSRVLLTIDRRRFEALMAAAAGELDAGNPARAVRIYVEGLGEYGFDPGTTEARADGTVAQGQAQIAALLETDGLAIQIGGFDARDYGLTGERFATARETVRARALGEPASDDPAFVPTVDRAVSQAQAMIDAFGRGDFADAQSQIDAYFPLLEDITSIYRVLLTASGQIAAQESLNSAQGIADETYAYNWHIRFVNDIVHGRPITAGSDERRDEGVLHAVESVWEIVANGPVEATRSFGSSRYAGAVDALFAFPWSELSTPRDSSRVEAHASTIVGTLAAASLSYRTTLQIFDVARSLELAVPESVEIASAADLFGLLDRIALVEDDGLRELLMEAATVLGSATELADVVPEAADAFRVGASLASGSSTNLLEDQRRSIRERLDELYDLDARWTRFSAAVNDADPQAARSLSVAIEEHAAYIAGRIAAARGYERAVVQQIADIRIAELNSRMVSLQSTIAAATRDLEQSDPVSGAPRPVTDQARDRFQPIVGSVSGVRVTSTANGALQALRDAAEALARDLRGDDEYIESDSGIRSVISRADQIASTVGTTNQGLLQTARTLLERSLEQIAEARRLEGLAFERVEQIRDQIDEAERESVAGNVREASLILAEAEDLLSSNSPDDASNLFTASLENWYRSSIESQWDTLRAQLSGRLNETRRRVVVARVDMLVDQAEPLVIPPPGEEARPGEALILLEEAEALWASVFPFVQNVLITPLLRRARILESQQQQDLTEDVPGFARLSQILNTARTAFDERNYDTAQLALAFFLTEQPLNAQARLLDIRLELATRQGSADAIVGSYVTRSLGEVIPAEASANTGPATEREILNAATQLRQSEGQSGGVADQVFAGLLPLRSKLTAIQEIVRQQGGASQATQTRISNIVSAIDTILDPPRREEGTAPGEDPQQLATEIIERQLARGDWRNLPDQQKVEVYQELERARGIYPGEQVVRYIEIIQSYLPTVRLPSPSEQAIMTEANRLVQQGNLEGALAELERYMSVASEDPMLIPDWRRLYDDLRRRLRRQ